MRRLVLLLVASACVLSAQENLQTPEPARNARRLWKGSLVSLAAANALDFHSSWGKHELNPTLAANPSFGSRSAVIKLGFQGGLMGFEYLITRGHPSGKVLRVLSYVNFGAAAGVGAVAAHNYTVGRPVR